MSLALKELIRIGEKQLADAGVADAAIDARELYCYMMGYDRVDLMMHWQEILQDNRCEAYFELIARRASRIPLQHITGEQEFMGLKFWVSDKVLIPRQDTETMVEDALELLTKGSLRGSAYAEGKLNHRGIEVLDLCCGSGAIGISIAAKCERARVSCSDLSGEALEIARKNAERNKCRGIKFIESDMFESKAFHGAFGNKKFDLIISNPPYIESKVIEELEPEVRNCEPRLALDGGEDGLHFYRIIAEQAAAHLAKNGILMTEIGYDQQAAVAKLLEETEAYEKIIGLKDLAGRDRIIVATKKNNKRK